MAAFDPRFRQDHNDDRCDTYRAQTAIHFCLLVRLTFVSRIGIMKKDMFRLPMDPVNQGSRYLKCNNVMEVAIGATQNSRFQAK